MRPRNQSWLWMKTLVRSLPNNLVKIWLGRSVCEARSNQTSFSSPVRFCQCDPLVRGDSQPHFLHTRIIFPRICPGADHSKFIFREMQPSSIYRILQKRAELALIGKVRPHDLRRTFATRMLEQGCDLFILQRAMGHTSVATTARYDFRAESSREKVCKNLEVFG